MRDKRYFCMILIPQKCLQSFKNLICVLLLVHFLILKFLILKNVNEHYCLIFEIQRSHNTVIYTQKSYVLIYVTVCIQSKYSVSSQILQTFYIVNFSWFLPFIFHDRLVIGQTSYIFSKHNVKLK